MGISTGMRTQTDTRPTHRIYFLHTTGLFRIRTFALLHLQTLNPIFLLHFIAQTPVEVLTLCANAVVVAFCCI